MATKRKQPDQDKDSEEEKDPFQIIMCPRYGTWEKLMNGIPVQLRNFLVRQHNYKRVSYLLSFTSLLPYKDALTHSLKKL